MPEIDHPAVESGNVLLLDGGDCDCIPLFDTSGRVNFLGVTFSHPPSEFVAERRSGFSDPPARTLVVTDGTPDDALTRDSSASVRTVETPGDLAAIGIAVSETLDDWPDDARTHLCFDSVTALLQYAGVDTVFRFLRTLTAYVDASGGVAHYHVDPEDVDERTLYLLASLFDDVLRCDGTPWSG